MMITSTGAIIVQINVAACMSHHGSFKSMQSQTYPCIHTGTCCNVNLAAGAQIALLALSWQSSCMLCHSSRPELRNLCLHMQDSLLLRYPRQASDCNSSPSAQAFSPAIGLPDMPVQFLRVESIYCISSMRYLSNIHSWVQAAATIKVQIAAQNRLLSSQQVHLNFRACSTK